MHRIVCTDGSVCIELGEYGTNNEFLPPSLSLP